VQEPIEELRSRLTARGEEELLPLVKIRGIGRVSGEGAFQDRSEESGRMRETRAFDALSRRVGRSSEALRRRSERMLMNSRSRRGFK